LVKSLIDKYKKMPQQVKASLWFVICGLIQKGISFLTTPIFSRLLTTTEYGVYSLFITWQNVVTILASLNLASGVYLRGLIKYEDDSEEFTASLQSLYVLNFLIVFGVYGLFHNFLNDLMDLPTVYMVYMFADILVRVAFQFWSCRQRVHYLYRALVGFTILNAVLRPLVGVWAVLNSVDRVNGRIVSMIVVDLITFGGFFLAFFIKKGKKISFKYWKYALGYNLPLVPHYLSQFILNQSDRVMIKELTSTSDAGIYSLAYNVAVVLTIVNQSIQNSYNPWMYQKIRDKEYDRIAPVSYSILGIVAVLNLALIILGPEIIWLMAPPTYHAAIWVIPPVAMGTYFMFLYGLFSNFEFYFEKTKYMMVASVSGAVLNIVLNYIFIQKYGFLAAGYTTMVCYLCYCIAHYILMRGILKRELPDIKIYDMRIIMGISLGFVLVGALFMALYNYAIIRYVLILIGCIFALIYRKKLTKLVKGILSLKKSK